MYFVNVVLRFVAVDRYVVVYIKNTKTNKAYSFTLADRQKIEAMERTGAKVTDIAKAVGFHRATIYNELKRGGTPYRAEVAQRSL